jgi:hypothetical protein
MSSKVTYTRADLITKLKEHYGDDFEISKEELALYKLDENGELSYIPDPADVAETMQAVLEREAEGEEGATYTQEEVEIHITKFIESLREQKRSAS